MREVVIAGIGQYPVGEHWELSLRNLSARAIQAHGKMQMVCARKACISGI